MGREDTFVTTYSKNNPMHKYSYGFKRDAYCTCNPPCGEWLLYHHTIDINGKAWVDMGKFFGSKEAILEEIVKLHLPTDWASYTPKSGSQAVLSI